MDREHADPRRGVLRPRSVATLLAAFFVLVGAASKAPPDESPAGVDVLLITIDTLRADALGSSGNKSASTPVLDRLAAAGRVFSEAHAHNVVTLPSHANILTGSYPYQHGVRDNGGFQLPPSIPTLATVLREAGYATAAIIGAYPLDSQFGLDRGFEVYDDQYPKGSKPTEFVFPERSGEEVVTRALSWWHRQEGRRFLWVHLFDPHAPYAPPEPFASRFRDAPYLGEVAAADSHLGPLLSPFLDGDEPPALIVVTSDHGEALGAHGEMSHGLFAYEATLKVPLILWGVGVERGRDERSAGHVDIFPTVLEATGVAAPPGDPRPGRSLLAKPGVEDSGDIYFEALSANLNRGWAPLRGLLRRGKKLIVLPLPELYDLAEDRSEAHNLIDGERELAETLLASLPVESVWPPARGEVSAAEAARLRALGYLTDSAPARARYAAEDDPKRLIDLDRKMHRVIDLYSRGRLDEAVPLAREIVAERPSMPLGQSLLVQALLESGATAEALRTMERAREIDAASVSLRRQLGLTLAETGRTGEALAVLRPLAAEGDPRSLNALALALSEAGRQQEAVAVLEQVLSRDPDNPTAYEELGLVALRLGRWDAARGHSRRAVELNDELPRGWNNLGVALWQLGQSVAALDAWQRAVELDPRLWDALYNLGTRASEHGRPEVAQQALEGFVAGAPAERYAADLRRARVLLNRLRRRRSLQ
ncbi:MAG: sulfatase-like hydrolase/transferase [bacterium]|nr:sulfatase-like hydrolase/transferase [bacterium]